MAMTFEIRPLTVEDLPAAAAAMARYFLREPVGAEWLANAQAEWEYQRTFGAFDNGQLVAMAGAHSLETTVPGLGTLPTMGLTRVGVVATHRRKGILRQLMAAQFADSIARGDVLSSLRASEATIYTRFGYGLAGMYARHRISAAKSAYSVPFRDSGSMRFLEPSEVDATFREIYDRVGRRHVGAITRTPNMWRNYLSDYAADPFASSRWAAVHVAADGTLDGFVDFEALNAHPEDGSEPSVVINDLVADDPMATLALWRFVLDYDLVGIVEIDERPVDEPIRYAFADARALTTLRTEDEQWVRLLDVEQAVTNRTYRDGGSVVVEVTDAVVPTNAGRYRLGENAGRCDDAADLALDVTVLGATYLGSTSFRSLATVGRVEERSPGAIDRADALCSATTPVWCGSFF